MCMGGGSSPPPTPPPAPPPAPPAPPVPMAPAAAAPSSDTAKLQAQKGLMSLQINPNQNGLAPVGGLTKQASNGLNIPA